MQMHRCIIVKISLHPHQLDFIPLDDVSVLSLVLFHYLPCPLHVHVIGQIKDYGGTRPR